ncbi:ABC transporter ATP-binding protein [Arsenicicoccus dermatophilus]|uniref:ABC transporter ATP-binding protein n=1 Tax=Arsenicicoccus dermatophilus TaxID=1076331 RepID=UPI003916E8A5
MDQAVGVEDLWVGYGQAPVLRGISLELSAPGSVAVVGPSGSGKTTLLYAMAGLERPDRGRVRLLGVDTAAATPEALAALRLGSVGFVVQRADLVPELTLAENVELPLELLRWGRRSRRQRVNELVERLGLTECAGRRPAAVSGGQAQRAAIGRAVATGPQVIFADEPTGALDSRNGTAVLDLLLEESQRCQALLVMVTHDPVQAGRLGGEIALVDGQVVGRGA